MSVYLDYNATAKVRPEASAAVLGALAEGGNPSSVHAAGRAARARLEQARAAVADLVGAKAEAVTLLSGGTEANALAIASGAAAGANRIIVGATEHEGVVENAVASGLPLETWPVDVRGVADLDWLEDRLRNGPKALVCLMAANNETGVLQPVAEASHLVHAAGGALHVDAVQAAGKVSIDIAALGADTLAISAHKLGGPQGAGALVAGEGVEITRQLHGGGQERGRRSGTENVAGHAGFGAAACASRRDLEQIAAQWSLRDELARLAQAQGAEVVGEGAPRLPQTLCFALPGFESALQVMALDLAGVMISAGAACSSGRVRSSRVIEAMNRPDLAPFAIRVSGGWGSEAADWARCADAWCEIVSRRRSRQAAA